MEIGSEWRGWTIAEYLGGGSFSKVYRIEREEFGYKYEAALKVIRIPQSDDEVNAVRHEGMTEDSIDSYFYSVVKGITSELALLSQLSGNSNIVSYEDHSVVRLKNEFGWEIYLRMELVTPLFEHLNGKAVTARDIIRMGIDISKALEICEKNNIIHRDIKPDNIFYSKQGTYKLGDFGIARKIDKAAAEMTKVGTFSYMAPEVYKGQPYDHTVDIYSLGIILYQFMNRNRRPFMPSYPDPVTMEDNEQANMKRLAGSDMPVPCAADEKLAAIILKACAYNQKERYQNAADLRKDLESGLDDEKASRIIFSECGDDKTRSISSAGGSLFDETVTMFGTAVGLSQEHEKSRIQIDYTSNEKSNQTENEVNIESEDIAGDLSGGEESQIDENLTENQIEQQNKDESEQLDDKREVNKEETELQSSDNNAETRVENEKKPAIKIGVVIIVLLIAVFGGGTYWYFNHTVPSVVGMSEDEAKDVIEKAGLKTGDVAEGNFSGKIKLGLIDSQSMEKGSKVKRGTVINLTTSLGEKKKVPGIVGVKFEKAKKEVEKEGLIIKLDEKTPKKNSNKIDKGCIISQSIDEGTIVKEGTTIIVVKSKGPVKIKVPYVIGKDQTTAEELIKDAGLKVAYNQSVISTMNSGCVANQNPIQDEKIAKGSTVYITISRGQPYNTPRTKSSYKKKNASKKSNYNNNSKKSKYKKKVKPQ